MRAEAVHVRTGVRRLRAKRRAFLRALPLALLIALPASRAAPPDKVQREVNFLLGFVEGSGCEFQRNGVWYDSRAAQAHLRDKYRVATTWGSIDTTEQFIDGIATKSSMSGQPYMVRCNGGPVVASRQWLREELAKLRGNP
jgi:hypothetical protein